MRNLEFLFPTGSPLFDWLYPPVWHGRWPACCRRRCLGLLHAGTSFARKTRPLYCTSSSSTLPSHDGKPVAFRRPLRVGESPLCGGLALCGQTQTVAAFRQYGEKNWVVGVSWREDVAGPRTSIAGFHVAFHNCLNCSVSEEKTWLGCRRLK